MEMALLTYHRADDYQQHRCPKFCETGHRTRTHAVLSLLGWYAGKQHFIYEYRYKAQPVLARGLRVAPREAMSTASSFCRVTAILCSELSLQNRTSSFGAGSTAPSLYAARPCRAAQGLASWFADDMQCRPAMEQPQSVARQVAMIMVISKEG